MMTIFSLIIGFFMALLIGTCYVKFRNTDLCIQTSKCKWCNSDKVILRGFTVSMVEHYCPSCGKTFFTER